MRLSASNIAWSDTYDEDVYKTLVSLGYTGIEIAPTRIIPSDPYDNIAKITEWRRDINSRYGFVIPSMQSIWYGRKERLFGSIEERRALIEYTKKAVLFAKAAGCGNLVFGCPVNRAVNGISGYEDTAISFFREIGDYAAMHDTVIGLEANPRIYNTDFINNTSEAFDLIEAVASKGFLLNLDVGTMIHECEDVSILEGRVHLINHVHISEPGLVPVIRRDIHNELHSVLQSEGYGGFISVEMRNNNDIFALSDVLEYVSKVFL